MTVTELVEWAGRMAAAMAGEVPLFVYRGDSAAWRLVLWADPDRTVPYDLAGLHPAAQIRRDPDAITAVELRVEVELPNVIMLHLAAQASAGCPPGRWDLELTWPDGRVLTVARGPVTVTPDVTRREGHRD